MKFEFWNRTIEMSESDKKYFAIYVEYKQDVIRINKMLSDVQDKLDIDNWYDCNTNVNLYLEDCITEKIENIINEMSKYGVYDRTVEDYHIPEYVNYINTISDFTNYIKAIDANVANMINSQIKNAYQRAGEKITGNQHGIITNNYGSMLNYAVSDAIERNWQRKEAKKQFEEDREWIKENANYKFNVSCKDYLKETTIPKLQKTIEEFYMGLFDKYILELMYLNKFISPTYDEEQAKKILENFYIKANKEEIIISAIKEYPASVFENIEIFTYIMKSDMKDEFIKLMRFISYENIVANKLEEKLFKDLEIKDFSTYTTKVDAEIEFISEIKNIDKEEYITNLCKSIYEKINENEIFRPEPEEIDKIKTNKETSYGISNFLEMNDSITFICDKLNKDKNKVLYGPFRKLLIGSWNEAMEKLERFPLIDFGKIGILLLMIIGSWLLITSPDVAIFSVILLIISIAYGIKLLIDVKEEKTNFEDKEIANITKCQKGFELIRRIINGSYEKKLIELNDDLENRYYLEREIKEIENKRTRIIAAIILAIDIIVPIIFVSIRLL